MDFDIGDTAACRITSLREVMALARLEPYCERCDECFSNTNCLYSDG